MLSASVNIKDIVFLYKSLIDYRSEIRTDEMDYKCIDVAGKNRKEKYELYQKRFFVTN